MSGETATVDANTLVSHTDERGRTLSGMGADVEKLAETMERHAPAEKPAKDPAAAQPPVDTEQPAQPVSRGRQRFSDLTRERDDAKAAADAAKAEREAIARERDELRQRLEQGAKPPAPAAEPKAEPGAAQPTRPEPTEDEIGTKYKTYAEFSRDLAKWVVEQERATLTASDPDSLRKTVSEILAEERAELEFRHAVDTSQERARKAYPDFETLLNGPAGQIPLGRTREESIDRVAFIARHPQSEHIQYAILKDAALAESLQKSDPIAFGAAIAGLVPAAKPAAPAWTPPPAPPPTVGASTPTVAKTSADVAKAGGGMDEYRKKRDAELGRTRPRW